MRTQRVLSRPDLLRQRARGDFFRVSSARPALLWQRMMAGIIYRCADIMPRIARTSGAIISMTAPNLGGRCAVWRRLVLLRMNGFLQFRLRAMAEREILSAFLDDYAFSPLIRCPTVIARSICYVDVWAVWYVGLGCQYAGD